MFEENKQLKSVEILPNSNAINVCWENQILKDGVVISAIPHRCAYGILQRDQFLADVEGGEQYAIAAGWTDGALAAAQIADLEAPQ